MPQAQEVCTENIFNLTVLVFRWTLSFIPFGQILLTCGHRLAFTRTFPTIRMKVNVHRRGVRSLKIVLLWTKPFSSGHFIIFSFDAKRDNSAQLHESIRSTEKLNEHIEVLDIDTGHTRKLCFRLYQFIWFWFAKKRKINICFPQQRPMHHTLVKHVSLTFYIRILQPAVNRDEILWTSSMYIFVHLITQKLHFQLPSKQWSWLPRKQSSSMAHVFGAHLEQ